MKLLNIAVAFILLSSLGAGCLNQISKGEYCIFGQHYDIQVGKCITPKNNEEAYRGFSYERIIKDDPKALREYQISTTKWLDPNELQALISEPTIKGVGTIGFFLPFTAGGTRAPQEMNPSWTTSTIVTTALNQTVYELASNWSESNPKWELQIKNSINQPNSVKISFFRVFAHPEQMAEYWKNHKDVLRFVQTIKNDIDQAQRSWEPEQSVE